MVWGSPGILLGLSLVGNQLGIAPSSDPRTEVGEPAGVGGHLTG